MPRPLALLAAALLLVACDSFEPDTSVAAIAREATLLGVEPSPTGGLAFSFDYVGDTPSPCYTYSGYGTSTVITPGERDPEVARRVEVEVRVSDESEGVCAAVTGTVETELGFSANEEGLYVFAFARPGQAPLERRVRVTLGTATEEDE